MLQKRSALRAALVLWACASAAGVARSGRAEPGNEGALTSGLRHEQHLMVLSSMEHDEGLRLRRHGLHSVPNVQQPEELQQRPRGAEDAGQEAAANAAMLAAVLFAAAEPLARAPGSSTALLPLLQPRVLSAHAATRGSSAAPLAAVLYDISRSLYDNHSGNNARHAAKVYTAVSRTFAWLASSVDLAPPALPGLPSSLMAFPAALAPGSTANAAQSASARSGSGSSGSSGAFSNSNQQEPVTEALEQALSSGGALQDVGVWATEALGLGNGHFARLAVRVVGALQLLHADLMMLQELQEQQRSATLGTLVAGNSDRAGLLQQQAAAGGAPALEQEQQQQQQQQQHAGISSGSTQGEQIQHRRLRAGMAKGGMRKGRRLLEGIPPNFDYSMPPAGFAPADPAAMPRVLIPLVFHIMLYSNGDGKVVGPAKYDQAASYVERLVRVTNSMAKPTNFQFVVQEVRTSATTHRYLLLPDHDTWQACPTGGPAGDACLRNNTFLTSAVVKFPRVMNVFVVSDATSSGGGPLGLAAVPGSDTMPLSGIIFLAWDAVSTEGYNSLQQYNYGSVALLHELFHHLGLQHPWGPAEDSAASCDDDDYVLDTPMSLRSSSLNNFLSTATSYCMNLFWGVYGGDWEATYGRWSNNPLGVPEQDRNAWADSCPNMAGYDEIGNYMAYNPQPCYAAVGHFTLGQAQRAHVVTAELNPVMYAWGQWNALNLASPPPRASPPPESYDNICKSTGKPGCRCKASWSVESTNYAYCQRLPGSNQNFLWCEVEDPVTCPSCTTTGQCVLTCAGKPDQCNLSDTNATAPPPPPPRFPSPPPMPPPPPPRTVSSECMRSRNGCACRRSWIFSGHTYSYCSNIDGGEQLWCQVMPNCTTFDVDDPIQPCGTDLRADACGGSAPAPAPAAAGPVAELATRVRIAANCSVLGTERGEQFASDLEAELARVYKVDVSSIVLGNMTCGSIVVPFVVEFPPGTTLTQLEDARHATARGSAASGAQLLSSSFTSSWGNATFDPAPTISVLNQAAVCLPGASAPSALCAAAAPTPPAAVAPKDADGVPPIGAIVGGVVGGVAGAVLIVVFVMYLYRNRRVYGTNQDGGVGSGAVRQASSSPPFKNQVAPDTPRSSSCTKGGLHGEATVAAAGEGKATA